MISGFANGRGEFYDQEMYHDRSILQPAHAPMEHLFRERGGWQSGFETAGRQFRERRGEFHAFQKIVGQWVMVRFIFTGTKTSVVHGEQAFSTDGGKTWAPNWIIDMTRAKANP